MLKLQVLYLTVVSSILVLPTSDSEDDHLVCQTLSDCVASSTRPIVYHPHPVNGRYKLDLLKTTIKRASSNSLYRRRSATSGSSSSSSSNNTVPVDTSRRPSVKSGSGSTYPTLFAEGREGALVPLVPVEQMSSLVRRTCQQWNLVHNRLVCAQWKLSMMATHRHSLYRRGLDPILHAHGHSGSRHKRIGLSFIAQNNSPMKLSSNFLFS